MSECPQCGTDCVGMYEVVRAADFQPSKQYNGLVLQKAIAIVMERTWDKYNDLAQAIGVSRAQLHRWRHGAPVHNLKFEGAISALEMYVTYRNIAK